MAETIAGTPLMAAEELLIGAAIPGSVESAHRSLPFLHQLRRQRCCKAIAGRGMSRTRGIYIVSKENCMCKGSIRQRFFPSLAGALAFCFAILVASAPAAAQ